MNSENDAFQAMKRTHSVEIIEPSANKRLTNETNRDSNNQSRYNRDEAKNMLSRLRVMFPHKTENLINNILQKHLNDLDLNKSCNELIDNENVNKNEEIMIVNTPHQQPTTSEKAAIVDDLEKILQIVPDCDPEYIKAKLRTHAQRNNRVDFILSDLFEKSSYPRLKDKNLAPKKTNKLENLLNMDLSIEEFLKIYPHPIEYFNGSLQNKNNIDENYKEHCRIFLSNKYSQLSTFSINKVFSKNKFYFLPTIKEIQHSLSNKKIFMNEAVAAATAPTPNPLDMYNNRMNRKSMTFSFVLKNYKIYKKKYKKSIF